MSEERTANDLDERLWEEAAEWWVTIESATEQPMSDEDAAAWQQWKSDPDRWRAFLDIARLSREVTQVSWPIEASNAPLAEDPFDASTTVSTWRENARLSHPPLRHGLRRRRTFALAAIAASVVLAAWVIQQRYLPAMWSTLSVPSDGYETQLGEHRQVILPDGSTVELGARTSLTTLYSSQRRTVVLNKGVAIFSVEHNISRPFVVQVARGSVTALGTEFQVLEDTGRTVVTVTDGTVLVAPDRTDNWTSKTVSRNEQVTIESSGPSTSVETVDPSIATAWRGGRLQYLDEPLAHVIADVNRYSQRPIRCDDSACSLLYTGTVFERDVVTWVQGLPQIFPVSIADTDPRDVVVRPR